MRRSSFYVAIIYPRFLTENGKLYSFGSGREGQIGRGNHVESSASNRLKPVQVDFFEQNKLKVDKVVCGGLQTFAFVTAELPQKK